jgi:hypothetical protein
MRCRNSEGSNQKFDASLELTNFGELIEESYDKMAELVTKEPTAPPSKPRAGAL